MKRIRKLFEPQTDLKSYTYPIVKLICCPIVYILLFNRFFIPISSQWMNIILSILVFVILIPTILCFYVAMGELIVVAENRKKAKKRPKKTKAFSVDTVVKMTEENDILEIEILSAGKVITIGASADCNRSGVFFDKRYYIEEAEYETPALFKDALSSRFPGGSITVCAIDGIPPE